MNLPILESLLKSSLFQRKEDFKGRSQSSGTTMTAMGGRMSLLEAHGGQRNYALLHIHFEQDAQKSIKNNISESHNRT